MSIERHISHTVVLRIGLTILMMLQSIFITRLLGPEGRGLFAKLQASQNFFTLFLGLGLASGLTYFISNRKFAVEKLIAVALYLWVAGIAVLALFQGIFIWVPVTDLVFPKEFKTHFFEIYFFVTYLFTSLQLSMNATLSGRKRFVLCNWLEISTALMRTLVFGSFFFGARFGFPAPALKTIFACDLALVGFRFFIFAIGYFKEFGFQFDWRVTGVAKPVITFSSLIYASYLINFLYLRMDYWFIERQLGLTELGIYSVASGLAQFLTFVPMTLNNVMLPHLSDGGPQAALQKLGLFSRLNATAVGALAVGLIIFAPWVIRFLYGDSFSGAVLPLRIVSLSFFFLSIKHLFAYFNISQQRTRFNIAAEVMGLAIGLTLNLILIRRYGILGACISSLVANGFSSLYVIMGIVSHWRLSIFRFLLVARSDVTNMASSLIKVPAQ